MTSDVTAVVLTIGEPFAERAMASIARQTHPPHEVIAIENVTPFSRALNEAARRTGTPFFVQVDADMVLDPNCIGELRAMMTERTGIACAELRDPLLGQVVGIKLFRTECFAAAQFPDSVSPDTDFGDVIARSGWTIDYFGHPGPRADHVPPTLGEHRPDYTPAYAYRKFLIEGRRYRYRGARGGMQWHFRRLEASAHPLAIFAQLATAHGFFMETNRDELRPATDDPSAARLSALLASDRTEDALAKELLPLDRFRRPGEVFRIAVQTGADLAAKSAGATIRKMVIDLRTPTRDLRPFVAKIGLGQGILGGCDQHSLAKSDELLEPFVVGEAGRITIRERLLGRTKW